MIVFVVVFILMNSIVDGNYQNVLRISPVDKNDTRSNETHQNYFNSAVRNNTNFQWNFNSSLQSKDRPVDCFGLGPTIASGLSWFFLNNNNRSDALDIRFFLTSRNKPYRVEVMVGTQFGLEWTDFKVERPSIFIVHGFLSHGNESWINDMKQAFLLWDDVNVVIVDWSARGNTWNYYKAAVNTIRVGQSISQFLSHIVNATIESNAEIKNWGPIHLVGHSLGAHICGVAAKTFKKLQTTWKISRITGLDPAQPCFSSDHRVDRSDAPFVDVIHTNGQLISKLGLGLPDAIGHVDFYPNGGKAQPGCATERSSVFDYLGIPKSSIQKAICSHGRSYLYFTESIIVAKVGNGTFWGHSWDRTYRRAVDIMEEVCNEHHCIEMGIKAVNYRDRGTFFVMTSTTTPFCEMNEFEVINLKSQMRNDFNNEHLD